jgi:enoyl-CoA hydratase
VAIEFAVGYTSAMSWELERDDHVVIVRMTGTKANVQNDVFFEDLHAAFDRLESEFANCAVVLTSADARFSAGIDFESAFAILASSDLAMMADWIRRYQATNLRLWRYPRPTVAAINGHAYAGGVITALDCDYRVAAEGARFSLNEVPIGIAMPAIYIEIIRYAVGGPAAALTTLFGREYDTQDALRLGFVHAVTTPERLLGDAIAMARAVPPDAFEAYAFSKRALQAPALERIETVAARLDDELPALLSSDANVRVRAQRYAEIKGHAPAWARERANL